MVEISAITLLSMDKNLTLIGITKRCQVISLFGWMTWYIEGAVMRRQIFLNGLFLAKLLKWGRTKLQGMMLMINCTVVLLLRLVSMDILINDICERWQRL